MEVEEEEEDRARIANLEIALPYPFALGVQKSEERSGRA